MVYIFKDKKLLFLVKIFLATQYVAAMDIVLLKNLLSLALGHHIYFIFYLNIKNL